MALMKARPARPEVDHLFDRLFDWSPLQLSSLGETFETTWMPSIDMTETDRAYVVRLEVPGIPKENLDVTLDGNVLTLSGRRESVQKEEREKIIRQEREEGRFVRSIRLPTGVVEDKINAAVDDGVLTVRLLKAKPATKSKIVIK